MNLIGVVIVANILGSIMAQDCKDTIKEERCLNKSEVTASQRSYFGDGDPCFTYQNKRRCFIKKGTSRRYACKCNKGCGCSPIPLCDNSAVPRSFVKKCGNGYGNDNTMCKYVRMGSSCGTVCNRTLTNDDKERILKIHNDYRRKVAKGLESNLPSASNMNQLQWDRELEEVAQRWADQCPSYVYDKNRKTLKNPSVSQNIGLESSEHIKVVDVVKIVEDIWYSQVKDFTAAGVDSYSFDFKTHRYTTLVWAGIKKIGCGFTQSFTGDSSETYNWFLVCNYSPSSNLMRQSVYKRGNPGADCQNNKDGLCA